MHNFTYINIWTILSVSIIFCCSLACSGRRESELGTRKKIILNHENPFSSIKEIELVGMRRSSLSGWDTPQGVVFNLELGTAEELILTDEYLQRLRSVYPFVIPESIMNIDEEELKRDYFAEKEIIADIGSGPQVSPDLTKFSIRTREFLKERTRGEPRPIHREAIWRLYCWDNVERRLHLVKEVKSLNNSMQYLAIEGFSASGKSCLYSYGDRTHPTNVIHNLETDSSISIGSGEALRVSNGLSYLIFNEDSGHFTAWSETGEKLGMAQTSAIPIPRSAFAITSTAFIIVGFERRNPDAEFPDDVAYTLDLETGVVTTLGLTRIGAFVTKVVTKAEAITEDID